MCIFLFHWYIAAFKLLKDENFNNICRSCGISSEMRGLNTLVESSMHISLQCIQPILKFSCWNELCCYNLFCGTTKNERLNDKAHAHCIHRIK